MSEFDVLIIGGGTGGVAAALACARSGKRVLLTEETDWIGGQLTSQAVPPDEHPWIEDFGCTRSYRQFRNGVRQYYRDWFPLTTDARADAQLNPGGGFVSRLCHEPRVALAVLESLLAPFVSSGLLTIWRRHVPIFAQTNGDFVTGVTLRGLETGKEISVSGKYVLDATETGELLKLASVEYVIGAEARSETGEPHAAETYQPLNQQAVTHCFAVSYHPGENWTIEKPRDYAFWKTYQAPFWPGPHLGWTDLAPTKNAARAVSLFGPNDDPGAPVDWSLPSFFAYRMIRDRRNFDDGGPDISLINWPQNDYWLAPLVDSGLEESVLNGARQVSLSLLYWLQTDAPHPNSDATGYPGLRLRPDVVGTEDGLAKSVYVRESRRIRAEFTVVEQHIASASRPSPEVFFDSVGIGCYRIDLHPSTMGDSYIDVGCHPFQIPLGALIPVRVENLLPACKNLGVTHITNGAFRLHPVEWAIGEAAGMLACFCLDSDVPPRSVRADSTHLSDFQSRLRASGMPLEWPAVRPV